jgi:hypothetical protein
VTARGGAKLEKIINAMVATVKSGLAMAENDVLPGPIKHGEAGLALPLTLC